MTETEIYMSETIETLKNALETTIEAVKPTIQAITFKVFQDFLDDKYPEDRLTESYNYQLSCIAEKGQMKEYKETLINHKKQLKLKSNAYSFILYGDKKGVMQDYWNLTLKPYLDSMGFKYVDYSKKETVYIKKGKTIESEEVTKVYISNSLNLATKKNTLLTIAFIVENFDISEELKTEFSSLLNGIKEESVLNSKVMTDNIELFKLANLFVKKLTDIDSNKQKGFMYKTQKSLSFIEWKLKGIKLFELEEKQKEDNKELADLNIRIMEKCKEDKRFNVLNFIAQKYGL